MTEYKKVFIDTAPFIYFLEKSPLYFDKIKKYFVHCMDEGIQLVTSTVTVEEYLAHPYMKKENELIKNLKNFLEYMEIEVFFTNDRQLRQEESLPCLTMDDL